ncbi:hypothetical protein E3N86_03390 [Cryobacterium sp. Hz7]|nr:hypothetical protein E3N86_03390 [Cryobacterium sp. Hz7]
MCPAHRTANHRAALHEAVGAAPHRLPPEAAAIYQDWIHSYNHHRPHTGIGGKSPINRAHNVSGNNS